MSKTRILHIGIKYWPIDSIKYEKKSTRGGGSLKYTDTLINNLPSQFESVILTRKLGKQKKHEEIGNTEIYRVKCLGGRKIRHISLILNSIGLAYKVLKRDKIDIIQGHFVSGIVLAYFLGKMFNKPVVGIPYNTTALIPPFNYLTYLIQRFIYPSLNIIIYESADNLKREEKVINRPLTNAKVVNTGVILQTNFKSNFEHNDNIKLLYVGRLVKVKAIDRVIKGLAFLSEDIKRNVHFDVIGEGPEYDPLCNLVDANSLHQNVKVHGFVKDIESFFLDAHLFVLPSFTEGLSISMLEAMSYGLPCLVNNFGVPFKHMEEIIVMKNNKPDTIKDNIEYLVNNRNILEDLSKNSRNAIINRFSREVFIEDYMKIYNNLANSSI